jgi:hypothetical protein
MLPHEPTEGSSAKPMFRVAATTLPHDSIVWQKGLILLFYYFVTTRCNRAGAGILNPI